MRRYVSGAIEVAHLSADKETPIFSSHSGQNGLTGLSAFNRCFGFQMSVVDLMRRSLALQRAMRPTPNGHGELILPLRGSDILVLGLIIEVGEIRSIEAADETLRLSLKNGLSSSGFDMSAENGSSSSTGGTLFLLDWTQTESPGQRMAPGSLTLLYGLSGFVRLPPAPGGNALLQILPLSSQAPALWSTSLAWLARDEEAAAACLAITRRLCALLSDRELDAFWLFERVQQLEIKLQQTHSRPSTPDTERVARLEKEVAELRRSGLLQQHLLIAEAASKIEPPI